MFRNPVKSRGLDSQEIALQLTLPRAGCEALLYIPWAYGIVEKGDPLFGADTGRQHTPSEPSFLPFQESPLS